MKTILLISCVNGIRESVLSTGIRNVMVTGVTIARKSVQPFKHVIRY